MHAMDSKPQRIEPDPNFFMTDENSGLSVQHLGYVSNV